MEIVSHLRMDHLQQWLIVRRSVTREEEGDSVVTTALVILTQMEYIPQWLNANRNVTREEEGIDSVVIKRQEIVSQTQMVYLHQWLNANRNVDHEERVDLRV